ncbi:MAG: ABC transporter permease [Halanaerobiales bacterium]|nr:ABC transporter permease [Halanaerobiales bacterium]
MKNDNYFSTLIEKTKSNKNTVLPVITILLVIIIFQTINPVFLKAQGRITLVYSMSYFLIAALGLTFVVMMGSFDFSIVSLLKLSALICGLYINKFGLWVIPLAILVCVCFGFVSGFLFAKLKVPSFIATLGISLVAEGIALLLSKGHLLMITNSSFRKLAVTFIGGIPAVFYWAVGICIVSTLIAFILPFGRRVFAIGENAKAASMSGINVDRTRIYVFMLSGFFCGIAGVLYMAQMGGGSVGLGADMMIPLFASVVAGGTALTGGVGGPHRTFFGAIIITWTESGMLMNGASRGMQVVVLGIMAIIMSIATLNKSRI